MVIFGPVLDASGSWGLGVVEADDEQQMRAFAAGEPVVTTGHDWSREDARWLCPARAGLTGRLGIIWASAADSPDLHALQSVRDLSPDPLIAGLRAQGMIWADYTP
jgi:hypothetical protein